MDELLTEEGTMLELGDPSESEDIMLDGIVTLELDDMAIKVKLDIQADELGVQTDELYVHVDELGIHPDERDVQFDERDDHLHELDIKTLDIGWLVDDQLIVAFVMDDGIVDEP